MTPGYWHANYWPAGSTAYWPTDYWPEYGTETPASTPSEFVVTYRRRKRSTVLSILLFLVRGSI
jgi:hypothetical protein